MGLRSTWTTVGGPAFDVLLDAVRDAKGDDPLAPVTVVTPTPAAAVRLRRELARRSGGTAVVSFVALDALAEAIAAPVLGEDTPTGVEHELVVAAVRAHLRAAPGRFAGIADHRATWDTLARTVEELASLTDEQRAGVRRAGALAADVVAVHDALADTVAIGGRARLLRAAAARIADDPSVLDDVGAVVVHLPGRLDEPGLGLLAAVAEHGALTIVAGTTGHADVDDALVRQLAPLGAGRPEPSAPPTPTTVTTTNDIDDEIRAAIRALLAHADAGHPLHTMALVHPPGAPYARTVAETLRTAGIPFSGPSTDTLGHTGPGRVVLALLDVAASGFGREALVDLWSSGLVVDAEGAVLRSVALDHRSRRLGVVGGRGDWLDRLAARRRWLAEHPVEELPDDPEHTERLHRRRRHEELELDAIDAAVHVTGELVDALPLAWPELAGWVGAVLDTLCGPVVRRGGWPDHELDADEAIRTAVGRLAALADVEPAPDRAVVVETLRATLDAPAPRRSGSGTGLLVTTLAQPPVVPLSAVAVVGMAEGHVPRVARDDVLLPDEVRAAAGLAVADDLTIDQRRALATALAAATDVRLLTYARCDQRSGRTQVPSRWLVDAIEAMTGDRPRTEHLVRGTPHADPRIDVVRSHADAVTRVAGPSTAIDEDEHRLAALAVAPDFDAHPGALDDTVAAGVTCVRSRAADAFTRFDGNLAGDGVDVLAGDRHLSPTGIETYATCPRKWFFRQALGLGEVDRPEEVERLQPADKGTLAHRILERFVGEAIEARTVPEPGEPWGDDDVARLETIADEEFADFERRGLTGHPRWWAYDRREILDVLRTTLRHDDVYRERAGARPSAVELTFGRDGIAPLEVTLGDGRVVALAGQADRVDEVAGGVRVYDYKYGSSGPYQGLDRPLDAEGDPLAGGRRLQLVAYAEAAAQQRGIDRTSAWYWFLKPGHTGRLIGYEIEPEHRHLFRETLRVIVDGVGAGLFPARSGPDDWWVGTNKNCGWCEFDAICPADREDEWERVRADPALAEVVQLIEAGSPSFLVTAPVEATS